MSGAENSWLFGALLVGLAPLALMGLTSFVKISTVLFIARTAVGLPSIPSNVVLFGLSSVLSILAMYPVGERMVDRFNAHAEPPTLHALPPAAGARLHVTPALRATLQPLREFYQSNASPAQLERFTRLARQNSPASQVESTELRVVVPAFLVTELLEAFALGFALLLPFLVVDLVIANLQVALGLTTLSTPQISLPCKLLLFVAIDGWGLLSETLLRSYG